MQLPSFREHVVRVTHLNKARSALLDIPSRPDLVITLGKLFLAIVAVCIAAASLLWPLSWDEGIFSWIGHTWLKGGIPYVDAWDVKGPVVYAVYAIAEWTFGNAALGARFLDLAFTILGCAVVRWMLLQQVPKGVATIGSLVLFLSVLGEGYNVNGQPDLWAGWLIAGSVAVCWRHINSRRIGLASCLVGTAFLIKPLYGIALSFLCLPLFSSGFPGWRRVSQSTLAMFVGFSVPIGICAGYFWSRGALDELVGTYIQFNLLASGASPLRLTESLGSVIAFVSEHRQILFAVPVVIATFVARSNRLSNTHDAWRQRLVFVWLVAMTFVVVLQRRFFPYHWMPLFPPAALAASLSFNTLWESGSGSGSSQPSPALRALLATLLVMISIGVSVAPLKYSIRSLQFVSGQTAIEEFEDGFSEYPDGGTANDVRLAAEWVRHNTRDDDRVLVWEDPYVNALSNRQSPGKFSFYTGIQTRSLERELHPMIVANRRQFLQDMIVHAPRYVLVARILWRGGNQLNPAHLPSHFPAMSDLIEANYEQRSSIGNFLLFSRR